MEGLQDVVFISEIVLQSKIAHRAAERLKANHTSFDHVEIWCSIQSILVAAGNVSKILWPPYAKHKLRGERLRQLLNVHNDNLLSARKFRNHFEHYDSRVEDWFSDNPQGVYSDLAMNPSLPGRMLENNHRSYNANNNILLFRGETLDLNLILKLLEEILKSCKLYVLI